MLKKKICMVGQFGVGKTSLVRRFVDSIFDERYLTTIGVKIDRKDVTVGSDSVTLMLWDLAGEDDLAPAQCLASARRLRIHPGCRRLPGRVARQSSRVAAAHRRSARPSALRSGVNKADLRDRWEVQSAAIAKIRLAHF